MACSQPPTMSDGCTVEDFASFEKMNEARAALAEAEDAQVMAAENCTLTTLFCSGAVLSFVLPVLFV